MQVQHLSVGLVLLAIVMLAFGCTKPYRITHDLEAPTRAAASCSIGDIIDELPLDFEEEKKPTAEDIAKFKDYLQEELSKRDIFGSHSQGDPEADYEVTGSIISYEKGSGWLRFLFGFGAGSARVTVSLRLIDRSSNQTVFAGNFNGIVTHWAELGDEVFSQVSKNFAKELEKQRKQFSRRK